MPKKKKNLLDLLYEVDAIEVEGVFCRQFNMEYDRSEVDEKDGIIFDVEFEENGCHYEFFFSKEELESAFKYPESEGWGVRYGMHTVTIVPYKIEEVKA